MILVLTGGPSAGKTTVSNVLVRSFGSRVIAVPEAATLLFSGGFHRADFSAGVAAQQKAIYQIQSAQELIFSETNKGRLLICDRGTIDGRAYWPESEGEFYSAIGSTEGKELARYEWVIHLDSAVGNNYNHTNNPYRREDSNEAALINARVRDAWVNHPRKVVIPHTTTFSKKVVDCIQIVDMVLNSCTWQDVIKALARN